MTGWQITRSNAAGIPGVGNARMFLTAAFERILVWLTLVRTRRMLATLDDRMLQDLGLDRATAAEEARKPFWHAC